MPWPIAAYPSVGNDTGWPLVYHLATPRTLSIMPSVAMNGGIFAYAMSTPLITPKINPQPRPIATGTITGRSVRPG
jgi:hypothetical protein